MLTRSLSIETIVAAGRIAASSLRAARPKIRRHDSPRIESDTIDSMRLSELSRLSGTSMPTIKYYVREGPLGSGERLNDTRTEYSDDHVHRLRLTRALVDVEWRP